MSPKRRRSRVEPTDDWQQLELLCAWPEQSRYELIRPMVLFGVSAAERSRQTGAASERTLYRRTERFDEQGVESLFSAETAKRRALPRWIRRMVVELKGEHPPLNPHEISNIVYVRTGRKPDRKTVKRVLSEEPIPLRMVRRFEPYHEIPEPRARRLAVVGLHAEGWTVKAIAGYLKINRDTVYETLKRWIGEGAEGLEDRPRGRPKGVGKVDLRAMNEVRKLQENPGLGAFRVRAALKQIGIHLGSATCGRILALNRRIYGLEKLTGISRWCADRLSGEDLDYLRACPPTMRVRLGEEDAGMLCFHGSPRSHDEVISATTPDGELSEMLSGHRASVFAGGHTHVQLFRRHGDASVLNPGSVGLPGVGPGTPDLPVNRRVRWAEYAVLEAGGGRLGVELRRVPLDLDRTLEAALASGMPHLDWWAGRWDDTRRGSPHDIRPW